MTVASAADASARAAELGASVVMEPFDVMGLGEMAVIADPSGAVLSLWEARQHIGSSSSTRRARWPGTTSITPDPETAVRFYGELFGWTFQEMPDSGGYRVIRNGERSNGGIFPNAEVPSRRGCPTSGTTTSTGCWASSSGLGGRLFNGPVAGARGPLRRAGRPAGRDVRGPDRRLRRLKPAAQRRGVAAPEAGLLEPAERAAVALVEQLEHALHRLGRGRVRLVARPRRSAP